MKVYVVEVDNGYSYSDNEHWVEKVYSTYRGATTYLLENGYQPYAYEIRERNEWHLQFEKKGGFDQPFGAWITEHELIQA